MPRPSRSFAVHACAVTLSGLLFVMLFASRTAQAQRNDFSPIYPIYFSTAGPTMDANGTLYGTTEYGGIGSCYVGCGTVFAVRRTDSGWQGHIIYEFNGEDGGPPRSRVIIGPGGLLYGTTIGGGGGGQCTVWGPGCGTVYSLTPTLSGPAVETVLYRFQGASDGSGPNAEVVFDQAGNMYGTTTYGGDYGLGTVFKLTRSGSEWTETAIYSFTGGLDGESPFTPLTFDAAGNLYGTATAGGSGGQGTVFELSPSGDGWTETTLYSFTGGNDGGLPYGGVVFDGAGNLYGDTSDYGPPGDAGTAFELTPAGGSWVFTLLAGFPYYGGGGQGTSPGPHASLARDQEGNLYGTTFLDGPLQGGTVFKLARNGSGWTYTDLLNSRDDPSSNLIFDRQGNLYFTAYGGGVFQMAP